MGWGYTSSRDSSVGVLVLTPSPHPASSSGRWGSSGQGQARRGFIVPGPLAPAGKAVEGFRAGKLFSYHLKTGMKCFSKASLQATKTSRAIPAFFRGLAWLPMGGGQVSPAPAAAGAAWGLIYCTCSQEALQLKPIVCLHCHGVYF